MNEIRDLEIIKIRTLLVFSPACCVAERVAGFCSCKTGIHAIPGNNIVQLCAPFRALQADENPAQSGNFVSINRLRDLEIIKIRTLLVFLAVVSAVTTVT